MSRTFSLLRCSQMCIRQRQHALRCASSQHNTHPPVVIEYHEKVAVLRLNRPKVLNAMTAAMGDCMADAVDTLATQCDKIGAVVVTGAGSAFSAGGDMEFLTDRHHDSAWRNTVIMRRFYERFLSIRKLPVPVIAAVNGHAIGAGLCFALACDIRIAAPKARLGVTFVGLGLHPGMGCTHFLPALVGPQVAARMMLTGETITSEQAQREGLVVAVEEDAEAAAIKLATQIASQGPIAVRTCVRTLRNQQTEKLEAALWREADAQAHCYAHTDLLEGLQAIREKRQDRDFKGYQDCSTE
eukprot:m.341680 g.341680  ORF g.341680 m.341680 type:complete len:298 (+) comp20349_c0_seq1:38-931(+)